MEEITFFSSTGGKIAMFGVAAMVLLLFCGTLYRKRELNIKTLTFSAIAIALATVLSMIRLFELPQGGAITPCSMLVITLVGYWFGVLPGILAGVTFGLLQLVMKPYVIHPAQLIFDYVLAFGALGLSGFFCNRKFGVVMGYVTGVLGRLLFSFLSGIIFFGASTPEGTGVAWYSLAYNGSYMGVEAAITIIILLVPSVRKAIDIVKVMALK